MVLEVLDKLFFESSQTRRPLGIHFGVQQRNDLPQQPAGLPHLLLGGPVFRLPLGVAGLGQLEADAAQDAGQLLRPGMGGERGRKLHPGEYRLKFLEPAALGVHLLGQERQDGFHVGDGGQLLQGLGLGREFLQAAGHHGAEGGGIAGVLEELEFPHHRLGFLILEV